MNSIFGHTLWALQTVEVLPSHVSKFVGLHDLSIKALYKGNAFPPSYADILEITQVNLVKILHF